MAASFHVAAGVAQVPISSRETQLNAADWWSTTDNAADAEGNKYPNIGAATLIGRCMRENNWSRDYANRVAKAYRQFLELKKVLEDWDASILAPSRAVDQMWTMHMRDPVNYCHDCVLLCGRVVGNDPDGKLDEWAHEKRIQASKQLLRARYESEVDSEIWSFSSRIQQNESRQDPEQETIDEQSRDYLAKESRASPVIGARGSAFDERSRLDDGGADTIASKYSDYDFSFRSGLSNLSSKLAPSKRVELTNMQSIGEAEILKSNGKAKQGNFQIRIRTLKGQVYHLTVNQGMTIYTVKTMIEEQHGTPKDQQHILFYGKVLEDWKTLGAHDIPPNAGLQLLARSKRSVDPTLESQAESITA